VISDDGSSLRSNPIAAETLREIALHQQTAAVLDFRARQATNQEKVEGLRRRAAQRRLLAEQLRDHLTGGRSRHPSART
jgi:hypothetical protein